MKKIILIILLISLFIPVLALAQNYGLDATAGAAKLKTTDDLPATAGKVIGTALSLIGVIFFALMIYGGFMWMTAQGKEEQAKKALDTIIAAIIGLVIILAAYVITNFVFKSVNTTSWETMQSTITAESCALAKNNNWGCKNIDDCNLVFINTTTLEQKRKICQDTPDKCALGLCLGGLENVCCYK